MSLSESPAHPGFAARIPVYGPLSRAISQDINLIFYLLVILVTILTFAVKAIGLAALTLAAVGFVPVMFVLLIWVTIP